MVTGEIAEITKLKIIKKIEELVKKYVPEDPTKIQNIELALVDLVWIENVVLQYGMSNPEILKQRTDIYADFLQRPLSLTLQDLVFKNPPTDQRLFSRGETANWEIFFNYTVRAIEKSIKPVLDQLITLATKCEYTQENLEDLSQKAKLMNQSVEYISEITRRLPAEEFMKFRKYYTTNTERNIGGPSALYSASFPTLDNLLQTQMPEQRYKDELLPQDIQGQNFYYATIEDLRKAQKIRETQGSLINLTLEDKELEKKFHEVFAQILGSMARFRGRHKGTVAKLVPEVMVNDKLSTGGITNVAQFLNDAFDKSKQSKTQYDQK